MKAPLPSDEPERLKALARYKILDTEPEQNFEDITLLASHVCRTPIALISLVDGNRQWFKSKIGMIQSETSRDTAFCAHGILELDFFEVGDALADERFATNPWVTGDPKIRFYAGSPLVTPDGHALGMLCVIDQVPRELSPAEKAALKALSRQVVSQLELRRDLAERKQSEDGLRQSEERFRNYFELGLIGMAITSPTKGCVEVNDEMCRILGYERAELLRMAWTEFTHPDDLAADVANFNRVMTGEVDGYSMNKRFIRKDGQIIDATISGKCLRRADGSVDYFVALLQDITERKRAEERLRQSEERLRAVLESALDCIVTMDHHGRVVEFNPAAEKTFGYKRDATIGQLMADLIIPPRLRERHRRGLEHYLSTREASVLGQRIELTGMRSDHSEFPVELTITRIGSQEPPLFTGFIRDITERKQAEEALAAQVLRYKTLMETSTDSIYVMDEKGDLQEANAAFLRRRGYTAAEVKGLNVADWDARHTREQLQKRMRKLAGSSAVFETRHRCKDGSIFDVEVCATSVQIGGKPLFFLVTRDITERKRAEQALRETEQRFRELAENINEVFWLSDDQNARTHYVSPAYERVWGRSCASLYAAPRSWMDAVHPEDKEQLLAAVAKRPLNEGYHNTYRIVRPDGSIRWIHDRGFPVRNESGVAVRFAGIAEDITSQQQTAEALRESEQQMRLFMEATADCLWKWDLITGRVVRSVGFLRVFGYAMEEVDSSITWWEERLHPDDRAKVISTFQETIASGGNACSYEYQFRCKDGTLAVIQDRAYIVRDARGKPLCALGAMTDITERKQVEDRLRRSEEKFKALFGIAPVGISILDRQHNITDANPALERIVRLSREELLGGAYRRRSYLNADGTPRSSDEFPSEQAVTKGRPINDEVGIVTENGEIIWTQVSVAPLALPEASAVVITQDITERKRVEQAQRESQLRYEALVQSIDGIVWEADPKTFMFTFVSKQAEKILGYPLEQWFEGPSFWPDHMHPDDRDWAVKFCVDSTARGEDHQFEYRMISADGRVVWLNDIVSLHIAPDQSVILRGLMVDITERKQADEALRESEERFRELAENINEVFWIWTATPGNARCLYVSPAYATIWGRSCESLYSSPKSWKEALHPQDKEWVLEEIARIDLEEISDWTYRIVRPDQSIRWIRDRIFPVRDERGAVVRFAGIAQDITESKEAEQTVRKTNRQLRNLSRRRIQEQEDERRRLSRELHDQIGQSLTAAKINVEALRSTKNPALVRRLDETAAILDQLLGQVRQISLDLRPPMLDDLGLVPALRSFIDEQGRRASVAVRFSAEHIPEKLDPEIQITCFRIAQEAITNAVRHAKATQLDIALRCTRGKELRLLARDDGIGFDAHPTQAQAVDLGLIGIRERAALVGGRARIISSPRKGTTIDVSLPLTFRGERQARHI